MFDGHARMRIALNAPPGEQANARLSNFAELMSGGEAYGGDDGGCCVRVVPDRLFRGARMVLAASRNYGMLHHTRAWACVIRLDSYARRRNASLSSKKVGVRTMNSRRIWLLFAAAALATPLHAEDRAMTAAAAVRAADTAFETRAQEVGPARAFREFMDETDGLQFGGGAPTRGAEAIYQAMGGATPSRSRLEWKPVDAWGSRGGDMGVTTGTWTAATPPGPAVTGRYVTVWRKNAAGAWKGLIDIGNPDPKP